MRPDSLNLRADAMRMIEAALGAVDPRQMTRHALSAPAGQLSLAGRRTDLSSFKNIYLLGMGKAGTTMALGAEEALGDLLTTGMVVVKDGYGTAGLEVTEVLEAGHPLPDLRNQEAARRIFDLAGRAAQGDLVICLISGGSSALMALPAGGISLDDIHRVTEALFTSGADIGDINAVRKHVTMSAGGRLARAAAPAQVLSLIVSDVIGDRLDVIASGPTVPDESTYADALRVLQERGLSEAMPAAVMDHLRRGAAGEMEETPKAGAPEFESVTNVILCSNQTAVRAAADAAAQMGYAVREVPRALTGEAREEADSFLRFAAEGGAASEAAGAYEAGEAVGAYDAPPQDPACFIAGGETTVKVTGGGTGGRAQEFVLAGALRMAGFDDGVLFAFGTDGTDGPTDAAGAFADGTTLARAAAAGLDPLLYLADNDAYNYFDPLGDLIVTGPTGTNVNDIYCLLKGHG